MKDFEDLTTWQEAVKLAVDVYKISGSFPKEETFGITSQVRRAVVSVPSNIAEGFGRRQPRDKEHFYTMSAGSLMEVKSLIYLCQELDYTNRQETDSLLGRATQVHKLLNALIAAQRKK